MAARCIHLLLFGGPPSPEPEPTAIHESPIQSAATSLIGGCDELACLGEFLQHIRRLSKIERMANLVGAEGSPPVLMRRKILNLTSTGVPCSIL